MSKKDSKLIIVANSMPSTLQQMYKDGNVEGIFNELVDTVSNIDEQLFYGPLPKTQYTKDYEYIMEHLLKGEAQLSGNWANFSISISVNGKSFNFSEILKNYEPQHVELSKKAKDSFHVNQEDYQFVAKPLPLVKDPHIRALHRNEIYALGVYIGAEHYGTMNAVQRTDYRNTKSLTLSQLKDYLMLNALVTTSLNHIPNKPLEEVYSFRGTGSSASKELDNAIKEKRVFFHGGFVSTSKSKVLDMWGSKPVQIMFQNVIGKDLSELNPMGEEEILMPPCQMQVLGKKIEDGTSYYIARPVRTLNALSQEQQKVYVYGHNLPDKVKELKQAYFQQGGSKFHIKERYQIYKLAKKAKQIEQQNNIPYEDKYITLLNDVANLQESLSNNNASRLSNALTGVFNTNNSNDVSKEDIDQRKNDKPRFRR